eukprot:scaffold32336_cov48-Phaeocystis_antarctica.AAC.1
MIGALASQLAYVPHATLCCLFVPAKPARQDTRVGRGLCTEPKQQPPAHNSTSAAASGYRLPV